MEPSELLRNSCGTPKNTPISLSLKKIYIYIIEEFREFRKKPAKNRKFFFLRSSKGVPYLKDTSAELAELQIYQEHKSLNYRVLTTQIGVPKPTELHPPSSEKLRNPKAKSEVKHGHLA